MAKHKKIATVTLNPAIDTMYRLKSFKVNEGHRTETPIRTAGGKGLNVSRVIRCLSEKVVATGFLGGSNGEFIRDEIHKLGIEDRFIQIEGETRVCLAFNDEDGNQTEVMEYGPVISQSSTNRMLEELSSVLERVDVIVISGSLPRGISSDFYGLIIEEANKQNVKTLLDTSGQSLRDSLPYHPFMIKPNRDELEQLIGTSINNEDKIWEAIKNISDQYSIPLVIVSVGVDGSFTSYYGKPFKVPTVDLSVVNPVGSGDSFVAGLAVGLNKGFPIKKSLALASACGAANVVERMTGFVDPENVRLFMEQIKL